MVWYRSFTADLNAQGGITSYFPIGIASTLLAILVLAAMYAKGYEGGSGIAEGGRFGFLVGLFVVFAIVADEYVTLNIGRELALAMAAGRLLGWTIVGMAIGVVYKPARGATG